jgi:lysophospholipase L1-like esterase
MKRIIEFLKRHANIFLAVFSPIVFFLALEIIFRIIPGFDPVQGPLMIKGPLARTDIFESDPKLFWRFIPNNVIQGSNIPINNLGFRGEDYNPARFSIYNRILCLGDSCTFGGEVGYGLNYTERLGYYLNKTHPNPLYKVLNCGVPGYSSYQILNMYRQYVDIFKPSTVIVWTASNDRDFAIYYPDKEFEKQEAHAYYLRTFLRQSHFCVFLASLISKFENQEYTQEKRKLASKNLDDRYSRVSLDDFRANLQEIIDISRKRHIRVILLTRHWYIRDRLIDKYNNVIRQLAEKNNVEMVDLAQIFLQPGFAKYYNRPSIDWVHFNREGYDFVGQEVAKAVLSPIRFY